MECKSSFHPKGSHQQCLMTSMIAACAAHSVCWTVCKVPDYMSEFISYHNSLGRAPTIPDLLMKTPRPAGIASCSSWDRWELTGLAPGSWAIHLHSQLLLRHPQRESAQVCVSQWLGTWCL
jgi:hypothetical protein